MITMNNDLISRQAAIDAMCSTCGYDCDKSEFVYDAQQDEQVIMCPEHYALSTLQSAEPERHGRWIDITNDESLAIELKCSECGFELINWLKMNYCPNCGAKMVGEQE